MVFMALLSLVPYPRIGAQPVTHQYRPTRNEKTSRPQTIDRYPSPVFVVNY